MSSRKKSIPHQVKKTAEAPNTRKHRTFSLRALSTAEVYRCTIIFAFLLYFAHIVSLPIAISYDGQVYIDMADVLGTNRFPHDWNPARTPLYPLSLKFGFWMLGRQALTPIVISSILGLVGVLTSGCIVQKLLGPAAGSCAIVLLALFPTLVAYEHFALTEAGTFCFLALLLALLLWNVEGERASWVKTGALVFLLATGFYWRQSILSVSPIAALFQGWCTWRQEQSPRRTRAVLALAQGLLILAGPMILAKPWSRYANDNGLQTMVLKFGILKQALLSPDDPYLGENAAEYRKAIATSSESGNFYAGLRSDLLNPLIEKVFSKPINKTTIEFAFYLIRRDPQRYADGVGRTLALFAGARGQENENRIFREQVLSQTWLGSKIGDGPTHMDSKVKEEFRQITKPSFISRLYWEVIPFYDYLLRLAALASLAGLAISALMRNARLAVLCAFPVFYVLPFALGLNSVDRYAFPVYPLVLVNLIAVPTLIGSALAARRPAVRIAERGSDPVSL